MGLAEFFCFSFRLDMRCVEDLEHCVRTIYTVSLCLANLRDDSRGFQPIDGAPSRGIGDPQL